MFNNSKALQYNENKNKFESISWKDLAVGKIIKIEKNEIIPADVLILKSSANNGFCYLQTSSLDGETGLKPREAIYKMQNFICEENDLSEIKGEITVDSPNENIYSIDGSLNFENNLSYISVTNTLLRGGILRNVDFIYGIIIYTGKETKIMKNIKNSPNKLSSIETKLNSIIIYVIIITFMICVICTVLGYLFWEKNRPDPNNISEKNSEYIFYNPNHNSQIIIEILKTFGSFFTIFNTLIPISVMITIEITKICQVFVMDQDKKMQEKFGEKYKIFSTRLHEDLGNIKYIFTDKTGTLTKNEMEFKSCSIFSKLFSDKFEETKESSSEELELKKNPEPQQKKSIYASSFDPEILKQGLISNEPIDIDDNGNTPFGSIRESVLEFFLNISLNHNVLTEEDNKTKEKYYSGSSPDEIVLVQSAKEIGVEFIERSGDMCRIKILDKDHEFQVLHRFEYTSERKRSSIIVKDSTGNIKLYMKGADKVILDKINNYSRENIYFQTKDHLDSFCKNGLRTLVYSMKMIDKNDYMQWELEFDRIQDIVLKDKSRSEELEKKIEEIENKMFLMGATALEDKLQDNVKTVLNNFLEADINVWMLTGDQLDTSESIGYSCKLFNDDTEVYKLREGYKKEKVQEILEKFLSEMKKTEENVMNYKIENKQKKINSIIDKKDLLVNTKANLREEMENEKNEFRRIKSYEPELEDNLNEEKLKLNLKSGKEREFNKNIKENINHNRGASLIMNWDPVGKFDFERQQDLYNVNQNNEKFSNLINNNNSENYDKGNNFILSQKIQNMKKNKLDSENSQNNFSVNPNNMQRKNLPIDINLLNSQEVKFVGGNLDKKTNKITLNFVKNSQNSMSNHPMTPGYSKSNQAILSSNNSNNLPFFKNNLNKKESKINQNNHTLGNENSNYEPCDYSILRYMVDIDFFDEKNNNNKKDYSIIKKLIGQNVKTSKMDNQGIMEILPIGQKEENEIKRQEEMINYKNMPKENFNNKKIVDKNEEIKINQGFEICNLVKLLNDYKQKLERIESTVTKNPFDFVKSIKKDFSLMNFGVIIEGSAIMQCLDPEIFPIFWEVVSKSRSVICCRCSPNFKSNIVDFVKKMSGNLTLAIGDGGNDVNMIKSANIGVGIFGKEGHQAAFNSDYAISQFKYLERLLFLHGRYSLLRNSYFINFFFFKNLIFTFPQFWFSIFSGFSGALLWDDWYYLGYNSYLSTLPAAAKMLFDEDIDITFKNYNDKHEIELQTRETNPFNIKKFFFVFFSGICHSAIIYFIPFIFYTYNVTDINGRSVTLWDHSIASYFSILSIQYVIVFDDTFLINSFVLLMNIVQLFVSVLFFLVYNNIDGLQLGGILFDIILNPQIWLLILLTTYICVLPFIIMRRWEVLFSNDIINNLRHKKHQEDFEKKNYMRKMEDIGRFTRFITKFRSMFTKTNEFEPDNLTDKKFKNVVDGYKNSRKNMKISNSQKLKIKNREERAGNYIEENNDNNNIGYLKDTHISNQNKNNSNANDLINNDYYLSKLNSENQKKQRKNSNYNIINSDNKNNFNQVHPYDEQEVYNVHLAGKFKPLTMNKVFNQNESYDIIDDYNNLRSSNEKDGKFDYKKKKFNEDFVKENILINENLNKVEFKEEIVNTNLNLLQKKENVITEDKLNLIKKESLSKLFNKNRQINFTQR